jgi:NAD(P)-dependent dehydrogenase (short-subunit alcohol dehydrogenase family)
MMADLAGKVVVVTGTSQGIGVGIVERCLDAGASVLGVSRRGGDVTLADRHSELELDLAREGASGVVLQAALDRFGRVDGLVNNAGALVSANCWEIEDEDWDSMAAVNLTAPFLLAQAFARHWREGRIEGTVVNICSVESEIGWKDPPQAGYAATKGALLSLTRAMAIDLAPDGIRAVAIGPGVIATEMAADDSVARKIPLGHRFGTPAEIGDAAVYLLSDRARYITGAILYVDGGYRLP